MRAQPGSGSAAENPGHEPPGNPAGSSTLFPPPQARRGPVNRPGGRSGFAASGDELRDLWPLRNTRGCETTSRWTALTRRARSGSARRGGRSDRLNLARESAICTSGMPSCRPVLALPTSRSAGRSARLGTTSPRQRRRQSWRTYERWKLSSAPRRCACMRPARTTGQHSFTKCSPMSAGATYNNTARGQPCTASWPAKTVPLRTRYSAPSTPRRRSPGIVEVSR
jgi:hypothetical protein